MDLRSVAILLLDHDGMIVFSNASAVEILKSVPALKSSGGAWTGPLPAEGALVEFDPGGGAGQVRLSRTRLTNGHPETGYSGLLLVRPGQPRHTRRERLQQSWNFTRAELRLAEVLLDGHRPKEAAESLGVTIHTVRTYLKRLYRKLGVHSQATLVCALSKSLD